MAYKQISPQSVAEGGSGASTLTGVLTGNGTSAFTVSAVTDNTVIMGSTSNLVQDTAITVTDDGEMVNTSQPAFLGILPSNDLNVSGDDTIYVLGGTTTLTEIYDQSGDFTTAGVFTAPVDGKYYLAANISVFGGTSITRLESNINTSNRSYSAREYSSGTVTQLNIPISAIAELDAADVSSTSMRTTDTGGKIDDVRGGASRAWSYFSGNLVC